MKLLKGVNYVSITLAIVLAIIFCANLWSNPVYIDDGRFFTRMPNLLSVPLFIVFSIVITVKTQKQKGVMLFALFLSLLSTDWLMQMLRLMDVDSIPINWLLLTNALTGTVYIKALQSFPRQLVKEDSSSVFPKNKILSGYINLAIQDYTWLLFPVVLIAISLLKISDNFSDLFVLLTALLCLYVNYKKSSAAERQKILWLFWGMICFTFILIIVTILHISTGELSRSVRLLINVLAMFTLMLSLTMSLFFSNTFDTGILIRRTLVDGFIFILIVVFYNTVEHYFLHWLSHELQISDVMLSSLLSGIFVLAFNPVHHKLMGYLEHKVKKHPVEHTH